MITQVAVVIPAADEQDEIGACLTAVQQSRRELHRSSRGAIRTSCVVVLDACRDATAEIVARFADVTAVLSTARCVGAARRTGVERALELISDEAGAWLTSTDADCHVPVDWLVRMVEHGEAGAELVLGTVRPDHRLAAPTRSAWLAAHPSVADHPHVHAANLGMAAPTYRALGGWRELVTHEDVDLVARALTQGVRIKRCDDLRVVTSSRLDGRAPNGFAAYLSDLEAGLPDAG